MTDHAAEARRLMYDADNAGPKADRDDIRTVLGIAQVHATLALVDEQRTANLIAAYAAELEVWAPDNGRSLADDIRARLGLTPTTPNQEQQP